MKNIRTIQNKLKQIDKKLYIVGGFCREKILGNDNEWDIDIVTDATPDEMKWVLKIAWEVGKKYGTCIVSQWEEAFELTTFRKDIWSINYRKPAEVKFTDSLQEDAQRRDFTFNAIYYNPETEDFIDPTWGIEDIESGIIRFVWDIEERINEDAIRILRFIRFKNRYSFKVADENYWKILKKNVWILDNIPMERIRQELDKTLSGQSNVQALEDLKQIGFLKLILPEVHCLDRYPWNKYHLEWDVWIHTKMCIDEMNIIIKRENIIWDRKLILLWAILLHDIWKAPTFTTWDDGESHYYDHENIWAEMFKNTLARRLKFSNDFEKKIFFLIREHIRVFMIPQMKKLKSRKLMMQDGFDDLLLLWEADNMWRRPQKLDVFDEILKIYEDFKVLLAGKIFFTGDDIMKKYPELEWRAIWDRLKQWNDQILVKD